MDKGGTFFLKQVTGRLFYVKQVKDVGRDKVHIWATYVFSCNTQQSEAYIGRLEVITRIK